MAKAKSVQGNALAEQTVVLRLVFHHPGIDRPMSTDKLDTNADKNRFKIRKQVLKSATYQKLLGVTYACQGKIRGNKMNMGIALPCDMLGNSYHMIPVSRVQELTELIDKSEAEYSALADQFATELQEIKDLDKKELKDEYNEADYFPPKRMRAGFWVESQLMEYAVPSGDKVGAKLEKAEIAKAQKYWADATYDVVAATREQFSYLVAHLAGQLEVGADGKKKVLTTAAFEKVAEWCKLFKACTADLVDDKKLNELVDKARDILQGKNAEALRDDVALRSTMKKDMDALVKTVAGLLEDAPPRRIVFDE